MHVQFGCELNIRCSCLLLLLLLLLVMVKMRGCVYAWCRCCEEGSQLKLTEVAQAPLDKKSLDTNVIFVYFE